MNGLSDRRARLSKERPILRALRLRGHEDDPFEALGMVAPHLVIERAAVQFRHAQIAKDQIERIG